SAIDEANILVTVVFEQPERIGGEPVVVIAVQDNRRLGRDTCVGGQFLEVFLADDVARNLILKLRLPVEGNRAGQVTGLVLRGIDIHLNETLVGVFEVLNSPIGGNEHIGHDSFSPDRFGTS